MAPPLSLHTISPPRHIRNRQAALNRRINDKLDDGDGRVLITPGSRSASAAVTRFGRRNRSEPRQEAAMTAPYRDPHRAPYAAAT